MFFSPSSPHDFAVTSGPRVRQGGIPESIKTPFKIKPHSPSAICVQEVTCMVTVVRLLHDMLSLNLSADTNRPSHLNSENS